MKEKIIKVLNVLDEEEDPSQRDIAYKTGISLGLINTLLKECDEEGLIEIKRLNSRNIKYILTPKGIEKITKTTINYVKESYKLIKKVKKKIKELTFENIKKEKKIYILKEKEDEIYNLVKNTLNNISINYNIIEKKEEIKNLNNDSNTKSI